MGALEDSFKQFPQEEQEEVGTFQDIGRGLKRAPGILAGFPADLANLINMGAQAGGQKLQEAFPQMKMFDGPEIPVDVVPGGSQDVLDFLTKHTGVGFPAPQTTPGKISEFAGLGGLTGLIRGGMKAAKGPLKEALSTVAKPTTAETLIGTGAGAGFEATEGMSIPVQLGASVVGGLSTAGALSAATRTGRTVARALGPVVNKGKIKIGDKNYSAGLVNVTSDVLKSSIDDVDATLARLELAQAESILPQSVPELLSSPTLRGVQASVEKVSQARTPLEASAAAQKRIAMEQGRVDSIATKLSPEGDPRIFLAELGARKTQVAQGIEDSISDLNRSLQKTTREAGRQGSTAERSVVAKQAIEKNLANARKRENKAWVKVKPLAKQLFAETADIKASMAVIISEEGKNVANSRRIPRQVIDKVKALPENQSLFELQSLRGDILEQARLARKNELFDRARKLNSLQETLLDRITKADPTGKLRAATRESAVLNETFHQGEVGKILGLAKRGDEAVSQSATLESVLTGGDEVATKLDSFLKATGPEGVTQAEGFLKNRFGQIAVDELSGEINLNAARSFLEKNRTALETLRGVRDELTTAVTEAVRKDATITRRSKTLKAVNERSQAASLTGIEEPSVAIKTLMASKKFKQNPTAELRKLFQSAKTPEAKRGAVRLVFDEIARRSLKETNSGRRVIDAAKLEQGFKESGMRSFMTWPEKTRFNRISSELKKFNRLVKEAPKTPLSFENESQLVDMLAGVLGARLGAAVGGVSAGGTIQTAGRGSGLARKLVSKMDQSQVLSLLEEAMFNPEVFRTMIARSGATNDVVIATRLRGHLANLNSTMDAEQPTEIQ